MSSPELIQNPLIPSTFNRTLTTETPRAEFRLDLRTFQGGATANISLTDLSADANLQVFQESSGTQGRRRIDTSSRSNQGRVSEYRLLNELTPGIYTIEVALADPTANPSANYNLNVAVNADAELSNILWRNAPVGEAMNWKMNGLTIVGEPKYGDLPAQWQVQGIADLNADGEDDLIWRDTTTGSTIFWIFKGGEVIAADSVRADPLGLEWQIAAVKDLDGDQQADLVWHNASGSKDEQIVVWLLRDGKLVGGSAVLTIDDGWKPVAAVDVNADTKADIIFHNPLSGGVAIWQMNGSAIESAKDHSAGIDWKPQFFGDFDSDGRTDIAFRNTTLGTIAFWLMDGINVEFGWTTPSVSADWQVEAIGNFDGSANGGNTDLLWRNRISGELVVWMLNEAGRDFVPGSDFVKRGGQTYNRGGEWTIASVGDFNADGQADIVYRNNRTGNQEILLMNGSTIANVHTLKDQASPWRVQGLMKREVEAEPFEISGRSLSGGFVAATAFNLGTLDGTGSYSDFISPGFPDYFRFNVGTESNVTLGTATAGVNVELFRVQNGTLDNTPLQISPEMLLTAGTYAIRVSAAVQARLAYTLTVTGQPKTTEVSGVAFSLAQNAFPLNPSVGNPANTTGTFQKNLITASFRVKNGSSRAMSDIEVGFRISRDGTINPFTEADARLKVVSNGTTSSVYTLATSLAAGATSDLITVQLELPDTDANFWFVDGNYTMGMVVDPDNKLPETNETNNYNVAIGIDKANLGITRTETTELIGTSLRKTAGTFAPGETITVSFTVKNAGNIPFSRDNSLPIQFYLSPDTTIDTSDIVLENKRPADEEFNLTYRIQPAGGVSALRANESKELTLELKLPPASSSIWNVLRDSQPLYLSAWIDQENNAGREADTTNNKLDPDLVGKDGDPIGKIYLRF